MKKYWKSPDENRWFSFIVDGKRIATIEDCASTQKEIKRLEGLSGIQIKDASFDDLIKANAKTIIPSRIVKKMKQIISEAKSKNNWLSA